MKKEFSRTSFDRNSFSTPQINVVKITAADIICASTEGYEDGDTSDWYPTNP